jgi:hypothetical protein
VKIFTNLTDLNLYANDKITNFAIKKLTNLTSLELMCNKMITTDDAVKELYSLTYIGLSQNFTLNDDGIKI